MKKALPARLSPPVRRQINPVFLEDICYRRIQDAVPEISDRSLDSVIDPAGIFLGQLQDQIHSLLRNRWPTCLLVSIAGIPVPGDEFPMPAENRFRSGDGSKLLRHLPAQDLTLNSQPAPLCLTQQDSLIPKFLLQYSVLGNKVFDHILLLAINPAGKYQQRQLPRLQEHLRILLRICRENQQSPASLILR
jgi:hypothetical protein